MTWIDLLFYLPLAFLSNTALPFAFDPVLIYFASRHSISSAYGFAVLGSALAGLAAVTDVKLLRWVHIRSSDRWLAWLPQWRGSVFYIWAFVFALLPLPFTVVRLAVLRHPPAAVPYAVTVSLGQLPRYVFTILLWPSLGLPPRSAAILLAIAMIVAAVKVMRQRLSST
jgi:hypothetical protein